MSAPRMDFAEFVERFLGAKLQPYQRRLVELIQRGELQPLPQRVRLVLRAPGKSLADWLAHASAEEVDEYLRAPWRRPAAIQGKPKALVRPPVRILF